MQIKRKSFVFKIPAWNSQWKPMTFHVQPKAGSWFLYELDARVLTKYGKLVRNASYFRYYRIFSHRFVEVDRAPLGQIVYVFRWKNGVQGLSLLGFYWIKKLLAPIHFTKKVVQA